MLKPFAWNNSDDSERESQALSLFGELFEDLSPTAAEVIRQSILAALANTGGTVATHRRFAFAGVAMAAPLLIVGAASAATGDSPLEGPAAALEAAAASVGFGGNNGGVRQDFDARNETVGDVGQPVPQQGNTTNAAGLQVVGGDDAGADTGERSSQPEANEPDSEPGGNGPASEPGATAPGSGFASDVSADDGEEKLPPHENDQGCDDVLFADGDPPFASPGGPVGCEVGNSADHRQNGVNEDDDEEQDPTGEPADEPGGEPGGDEVEGGISHGLGHGHDEDKPGNGNGNGHTTHGHNPNPNGHGPGGPPADDLDGGASLTQPDDSEPRSATLGRSGQANGKTKDK